MILFRQYARLQRTGLIVAAALMAVLVLWLAASAPAVRQEDFMTKLAEKVPTELRSLLGLAPGLSAVDAFIQTKLGLNMVWILSVYACLITVGAVVREVDSGTADFLLALPVDRARLVVARWAVMCANTGVVAATTWVALVAGLRAYGVDGAFAGYFWMLFQAWLVAIAVGSLALWATIRFNDYGAGVKLTLGAVSALVIIDVLLRAVRAPRLVLALSPFAYYDAAQLIATRRPMYGGAAVLLAVSAAAVWMAARGFAAREIEA